MSQFRKLVNNFVTKNMANNFITKDIVYNIIKNISLNLDIVF